MYQQDPFFSLCSPYTFFGSYQGVDEIFEMDDYKPMLNMQNVNLPQMNTGVYLHWFD